MKNLKRVLLIVALVFILTGCKGKEIITICSLESDQSANGYVLKSEYKIYSKKDIVEKVVINQTITSSNEEKLNSFNENLNNQYKSNNNLYGGYEYDISVKGDKLTAKITTDYTKLDMKKFSRDNIAIKDYLVDGKLTLDKLIELYKTSGIKCDK